MNDNKSKPDEKEPIDEAYFQIKNNASIYHNEDLSYINLSVHQISDLKNIKVKSKTRKKVDDPSKKIKRLTIEGANRVLCIDFYEE